ncbi:hypothetical protein [Novipirellula caenicola]|uniref:Secreted protein n=1 Tax=Novipirellula caenicola TaxID=1536901 RepID=A0ABP9VRS9_9BACT
MRRQSQTQLTAAVAMTLAVTISASVGCVSVHHDWAQHCGFDKLRESKKSYYHCAHCGQIVANPHAKCCPHCAYVKPYYGYEPTCWNKFPEGWGCPNGAQACHPEMLEMVPPVEYIDGIPVDIDHVQIQHGPQHDPATSESISAPHIAVENEHAIPSASDRMAPAANNRIDLNVPASKNMAKPQVRSTDQTQAKPVSQKRALAVLSPMETSLVDGMIEAPVPGAPPSQSAPSQSVAKSTPVVDPQGVADEQGVASEPEPMVINFPVPSPERAVTIDKVPSVTRVPVPQVDKDPVTKTPVAKAPEATATEATATEAKASAAPVAVANTTKSPSQQASAAVATSVIPQAKQDQAAKPAVKTSATPQHESPKVQRIAVPQPKKSTLDVVASDSQDEMQAGAQNATAKSSKSASSASQESIDLSAEQWNRIITMPIATASGLPVAETSAAEFDEMKESFEPVSIQTQSPRMVPTMTHLPKRVPTIPVEESIRTGEFTQPSTTTNLPTPVRRIPASVQQLVGENSSPVTTSQNVLPTGNVTPAETVAPVVNRIPLGQIAPSGMTSNTVTPKYIAPNQTQSSLYPAPANRIQIR